MRRIVHRVLIGVIALTPAVLGGCDDTIVLEGDPMRVVGSVRSVDDGTPIAGATVFWCGGQPVLGRYVCSSNVTTGADGSFELLDELPVFDVCPLRLVAEAHGFVPGETPIRCSGGTQEATVRLQPTSVLRVQLSLDSVQMTVGQTLLLEATAVDPTGDSVPSPLTWSTSDPSAATVSAGGLVSAIAAGDVRLIAEAGGVPDTTLVRVVDPPSARVGPTAYVVTSEGVVAIDVATGARVGPALLSDPWGLAVSPGGDEVWVAAEQVSVIEVASNTVSGASIPVGSDTRSLAFTPDSSRAYVTSDVAGTVTVIDTGSRTITGTVTGGGSPFGIAVTPDGLTAVVSDLTGSVVRFLDLTTDTYETSVITTPQRPLSVAITPDGAEAYVTLQFSSAIAVIDVDSGASIGAPIEVGRIPGDVAITPDGSRAYVANVESQTVSIIDVQNRQVIETVSIPGGAAGVAVTPNGETVWVTSVGEDVLRRINVATGAIEGIPLAVGDLPTWIVIAP